MTSGGHPAGADVALVVDALHLNGAVKITVDLAARWASAGAVLVALKRVPEGSEVPIPAGTRVRIVNRGDRLSPLAAVAALGRLTRIARRSRAVVVGSEIGVGLLFGYLAARIARKPFLIGVHADIDDALQEWMSPAWRPVLRWVHRRADGVICVEDALVGPVVANGLPRDRVRVVTNGIDLDAVREAARGTDTQAAVAAPRVALTGRLAPQKGTDLMLRAHAAVVGDVPHTILLLNDGPDLAALQALAAELGVTGSVVFAGRVPPHPTVAHADLFLLPSRHEGLPLALLEAMALGTPCIAADCSAGVRSALDEGRAGVLVPVGDVPALAAALRAALLDPAPMRRLAEHATAHLAHFDTARMAAGWVAAIDDVVAAKR